MPQDVETEMTGMHSEAELEYLEDILFSNDLMLTAMMPSEFDGLVAGVLLCPEPISPKDWLPLVLGDPEELRHLDPAEGQAILDALVAHYNRVAENFITKANPYEAMITFEDDDVPIWEHWVEGFAEVMKLNPEAFEYYADAQEGQAARALTGMLMLIDFTYGGLDLPREQVVEIDTTAPDLIPAVVVHMYLWLEQLGAPNGPLAQLAWEDVMMPLPRKTLH